MNDLLDVLGGVLLPIDKIKQGFVIEAGWLNSGEFLPRSAKDDWLILGVSADYITFIRVGGSYRGDKFVYVLDRGLMNAGILIGAYDKPKLLNFLKDYVDELRYTSDIHDLPLLQELYQEVVNGV